MKTTTPSYIKLSQAGDGQMAYGHADDIATSKKINNFLDSLFQTQRSIGFIRVKYSDRRYDQIQTVSSKDLPKNVSAETGFFTDALITTDPEVVLALPVADCIAMVVLDPIKKVLALAHLGWQATADELTSKLIAKMNTEYDCKQSDLLIYISPHIRKPSYHFPAPITQQDSSAWSSFLQKDSDGEIHIDITGFNLDALDRSGVSQDNIILAPENTADLSNHYGSNFMHNKSNQSGSAERFLVSCRLP